MSRSRLTWTQAGSAPDDAGCTCCAMHRGSGNSAPRPRAAAAASPATAGRAGFTQADILAALVGLGWRAADCRQPVERAIAALSADGGTPTAAAIIKHVLATADKSVKIGATS